MKDFGREVTAVFVNVATRGRIAREAAETQDSHLPSICPRMTNFILKFDDVEPHKERLSVRCVQHKLLLILLPAAEKEIAKKAWKLKIDATSCVMAGAASITPLAKFRSPAFAV